MRVKHLRPGERIAEYVERILVIENDQITTSFSLPLFANGLPTLLFKSTKGRIGNNFTTNLTLFGQTVLPEIITFTEGVTLIAYFFKPYSLLPIFGVMPQELTDKPVEFSLLTRPKSMALQEQLLNARSLQSMLALLDTHIANWICQTQSEDHLIKYAAAKIAGKPEKDVLVMLQKELCMTERTFQRMFEKNIGIPPNLYRRICQFNSAFQELNNKKYDSLTEIAFKNGYADQSHYIRSFKEFTNLTPKGYLNFGSPP
jgi:AraC-like DNA-binding protein